MNKNQVLTNTRISADQPQGTYTPAMHRRPTSPVTVPNLSRRYSSQVMKKLLFSCCQTDSHINDPKLSDGGVRRGTCMAGGKAEAEAGAVTHGAVRCSAWLAPEKVREPLTAGE